MLCLDHDAHALGLNGALHRLCDLLGEHFLDLQAAREEIDDAGDLGQPQHAAIRQVGDVALADEREHVVLAE